MQRRFETHRQRNKLISLATLGIIAAIGSDAFGASISASSAVCIGGFGGPLNCGGGPTVSANNVFPGTTGVGSGFSFGGKDPITGFQWQGNSGAVQDYGVFHADANLLVNVPAGGSSTSFAARAQGTFNDTWTINGPAGAAGLAYLTWTASGGTSFGQNGPGLESSTFDIVATFFGTGPSGANENEAASVIGSGVYPGKGGGLPFLFNVPFNMQIQSQLGVGVDYNSNQSGVETVSADFSHTLTLTGIVFTDSNGNVIHNASVTAASGTVYPLAPTGSTAAPEPSTLLMILGGLAAAAGVRANLHRRGGRRIAARNPQLLRWLIER